LTTLTLNERLGCPRRRKASATAKQQKKRRSWCGSRKFRTEGVFSSATVRGTKWLTEDRCGSTLTDVRKGRVALRGFEKRKTVIVRAGKQYVAKRKK
jgi:ferric-dicitrate binding protein FerR (iron transport regulator)